MKKHTFGSLVGLVTFLGCCVLVTALLVTSVARKRESARATGCIDNMRQIGLAFHNYHSAYKQLPAGTGGTTGNSDPQKGNSGRLGPMVGLLPFLEQQPLWEMISNPYESRLTNKQFPPMGPVPWYPANEYKPWSMSPSVYSCPGNDSIPNATESPKVVYTLSGETDQSTTTSYVACYGDGTFLQAEQEMKDHAAVIRRHASNRGVFSPGRPMKFRDVLDGLSNTIMFSEVVASRERKPGVSEIVRDVKGISKTPSLCVSAAQADQPSFWRFGRGSLWADGFLPIGGFQTVLPPNSPSCTSDLGIADAIASASSLHAGGVHILMCDGAVCFVSDTIDTGDLSTPGVSNQPGYARPESKSPYGLWGSLGSRAHREVIIDKQRPVNVTREPGPFVNRSSQQKLARWTDKSGNVSLRAEMVQIIDQKTIQLRSASGTIHEVPLNSLKDRDMFRAIKQDVLRRSRDNTTADPS